jgi:hypothetical protein
MKRTVDNSTVMSVHAQIKYKKSVWGVIKGFIEKNTWLGLEDFYEALSKALMVEYCLPPAKSKSRRTRKGSSAPLQMNLNAQQALPKHHDISDAKMIISSSHGVGQLNQNSGKDNSIRGGSRQEKLSWVVIILLITLIGFNFVLYFKLWRLDGHHHEDDVVDKYELLRYKTF